MRYRKAISLFDTQTFKLGLLGLLSGLAPYLIKIAYEHRGLSSDEAIAVAALAFTFINTLTGRANNNPVYTPNGLPGANKSDFQ